MKGKRLIVTLLALILTLMPVHAFASSSLDSYSSDIEDAVNYYYSSTSYETSVIKLNWKANVASMRLLRIIAKELDDDGGWSNAIAASVDIYYKRAAYETSVPKLNWKANVASMCLLRIIAYEVDRDNSNESIIRDAVDEYNRRVSYETSVPKLNWRANVAQIRLLRVIAWELDEKNEWSSAISSAADYYYGHTSDTSVPRLNWRANMACMSLLQIIAKELDENDNYGNSIKNAIDDYNSRASWETSVPKLNWKANVASMRFLRVCALLVPDRVNTYKINGSKVSLTSVKALKKRIKVRWSELDIADNYEVQISQSKKFAYWDMYNTTSTSMTIKKLRPKKTYYVRVRANKAIGGYYQYGKWSDVKKVRVK